MTVVASSDWAPFTSSPLTIDTFTSHCASIPLSRCSSSPSAFHSYSPSLSISPLLPSTSPSPPPASPSPSHPSSSSHSLSSYLTHLPPIDQHHFYHWCHIRALYESQFAAYLSSGSLLPLSTASGTASAYRCPSSHAPAITTVTLTTATTTVMPHATATTSTTTSYNQVASSSLVLPPSPPLLVAASLVPPAPFSYAYHYPAHPFSFPPPHVITAIPRRVWAGEAAKGAEEEEEEEEGEEDEEDEHEGGESGWTKGNPWSAEGEDGEGAVVWDETAYALPSYVS